MAEFVNETPPSSEIRVSSESSNPWELPPSAKEKETINRLPELTEVVDLMLRILQRLASQSCTSESNCELLHRDLSAFDAHSPAYTKNAEFRQFCGDFMAKREALNLIKRFIDQSLREQDEVSIFCEWRDRENLRKVCHCFMDSMTIWSDNSASFQYCVCRSGYLNNLLSDVIVVTAQVEGTQDLSLYERSEFTSLLLVLYNSSQCYNGKQFFRQTEALSVLQDVRQVESPDWKWVVLATMCNIAGNEERPLIVADTYSLERCIGLLKSRSLSNDISDLKTDEWGCSKLELITSLETIANRPENRRLIVGCGALPVLIELLMDIEDPVQIQACKTLRNLSLSEDVRGDIRQTDAENLLQDFTRSSHSALREAAEDALDSIRRT